jgi:hypothetical protein
MTETIADGRMGIAFLLGMDEIGFGENGATGSNFRGLVSVGVRRTGKISRIFKPKTPRLLIEKAARTRSTGGVAPEALISPFTVKTDETEFLPTHHQSGSGLGMPLPQGGDEGHLVIVMGIGFKISLSSASGDHGCGRVLFKILQKLCERSGNVAMVEGIGCPPHLPGIVHKGHTDGDRPCVHAKYPGFFNLHRKKPPSKEHTARGANTGKTLAISYNVFSGPL